MCYYRNSDALHHKTTTIPVTSAALTKRSQNKQWSCNTSEWWRHDVALLIIVPRFVSLRSSSGQPWWSCLLRRWSFLVTPSAELTSLPATTPDVMITFNQWWRHKGVLHTFSRTSMLAPAMRRTSTMSANPSSTAVWSGVCERWRGRRRCTHDIQHPVVFDFR